MGLVLGFELHGQVIGTIRMMPALHDLTLTEQLLAQAVPDFRARWPGSWDAGRLVLAPEFRAGQEVLRRCLYLTVCYLIEHTDIQYLIGSCTHVLGRLYRRLGFTFVAQNLPLAGTDKTYTLIHGELPAVMAAMAPSALEPRPEALAQAQPGGLRAQPSAAQSSGLLPTPA